MRMLNQEFNNLCKEIDGKLDLDERLIFSTACESLLKDNILGHISFSCCMRSLLENYFLARSVSVPNNLQREFKNKFNLEEWYSDKEVNKRRFCEYLYYLHGGIRPDYIKKRFEIDSLKLALKFSSEYKKLSGFSHIKKDKLSIGDKESFAIEVLAIFNSLVSGMFDVRGRIYSMLREDIKFQNAMSELDFVADNSLIENVPTYLDPVDDWVFNYDDFKIIGYDINVDLEKISYTMVQAAELRGGININSNVNLVLNERIICQYIAKYEYDIASIDDGFDVCMCDNSKIKFFWISEKNIKENEVWNKMYKTFLRT